MYIYLYIRTRIRICTCLILTAMYHAKKKPLLSSNFKGVFCWNQSGCSPFPRLCGSSKLSQNLNVKKKQNKINKKNN